MTHTQTVVTIPELESMVKNWIDDSICRQHSAPTIASKRHITDKFLWWLREHNHLFAGAEQIRGFLAYVGSPAPAGGRWGNPHETAQNQPRTVHTFCERLHTLFNWAVEQEFISESPMKKIKPPISRRDDIQPFTEQQVNDVLTAAGESRYPLRDTAICLFLLDTGARATELCTLTIDDLDLKNGKATVLGKGRKKRPVYFTEVTRKALQSYLALQPRGPVDPVFCNDQGFALTRSGLLQLIERLGKRAGITGVRCSPHTFRHTAAIWTIRSGMDSFTLQKMLGHTDLTMTSRYVAIGKADLEAKHRIHSPVGYLASHSG